MKLDAIDTRPSETVTCRLKAATFELAQNYKKYAAEKLNQHFKTDGQLIAAIVDAFVKRGDKDFLTWLRANPKSEKQQEKQPAQKVNGAEKSTLTFAVEEKGIE